MIALCSIAEAQVTATNISVADAFLATGSPNNPLGADLTGLNFGAGGALVVAPASSYDGEYQSLLKFNLSNAIASIAIAWINTKAAPFGAMIARREYASLDRLFFRSVWQSISLAFMGALVVWAGVLLLNHRHLPFAQRVLPPLPFAFLLISMVMNQAVNSWALYLRAHKQEKFLIPSVIGASCLTLSTYFLGRHFGALGMTSGQLVIGLTVGVGLGYYTFAHYRKLWHKV